MATSVQFKALTNGRTRVKLTVGSDIQGFTINPIANPKDTLSVDLDEGRFTLKAQDLSMPGLSGAVSFLTAEIDKAGSDPVLVGSTATALYDEILDAFFPKAPASVGGGGVTAWSDLTGDPEDNSELVAYVAANGGGGTANQEVVLSDDGTYIAWDFDDGNIGVTPTMTGDRELAITNMPQYAFGLLKIDNDGNDLTFPSDYLLPDGYALGLTTGRINLLEIYYDGTNYWVSQKGTEYAPPAVGGGPNIVFTTVTSGWADAGSNNWTGGAIGGTWANHGLATLYSPAATDATIEHTFDSTDGDNVMLGFSTTNANNIPSGANLVAGIGSLGGNFCMVYGGTPNTSAPITTGYIGRLARAGATGDIEAFLSVNGGASFISQGVIANSSAALYILGGSDTGEVLHNPQHTGLV